MESQTQNTLNLQPTNQQPVHVPHEERNYGMIVHLSALAAYVLPAFGAIIGPLVAWLVLKERSSYADDQGKEALNFNISLLLYGAAAGLFSIVTFGLGALIVWPVWVLLPIVQVVFIVLATIAANKGEVYRYPLTIRLVK
jgi:uncharacterized Tic20 family protein